MRESGFIEATQVDYHRNGVGGVGFYVVLFTMREEFSTVVRNMVATVFPLEDGDNVGWNGLVSVLDVDLASKGDVRFGRNSWRGDVYERELRLAIDKHRKEEDARLEKEYQKNLLASNKKSGAK